MAIFYNPSKIIKLMPLILIIDGTSKQHKRMLQEVFYQSLKGLNRFQSILCMCSIRDLTKLLVDLYYEPLSQLKIFNTWIQSTFTVYNVE